MDDNPLPAAIREQWPWQPRFARVNGWRMHYVDEGTGDPVVLLHGNPTWGFLYRDFVEPLTGAGVVTESADSMLIPHPDR